MSSTIGNMRERLVFEQKARTTDTMGGSSVVWSIHATVWGRAEEVSGSETFQTLQITAERTTRFTIRYLSTITEQMRVNWNGAYYDIVSILNDDNREKFLVITAIRNGST